MFYFDKINNKTILKSDLLKSAEHFFTTRESVVVSKDLTNLNEITKENLSKIANYLQVNINDIISPIQTHSCNIAIAKKNNQAIIHLELT